MRGPPFLLPTTCAESVEWSPVIQSRGGTFSGSATTLCYAPKSLHYTHMRDRPACGYSITYERTNGWPTVHRRTRHTVPTLDFPACAPRKVCWSRARSSLRTEIRSTPLGANGALACWAGRTVCPTTWDFALLSIVNTITRGSAGRRAQMRTWSRQTARTHRPALQTSAGGCDRTYYRISFSIFESTSGVPTRGLSVARSK